MLHRITFLFCLCFALLLVACDEHPGFDETDGGLYVRLDQFGDCEPMVKDAAYSIIQVDFRLLSSPNDSAHHFTLYHGRLINKDNQAGESQTGNAFFDELKQLKCGDAKTWIMPFSEVDSTSYVGYATAVDFPLDAEIELSLKVVHTFNEQEFHQYLMAMAQQGELSETEAINMYFVDMEDHEIEQHGDLFIDRLTRSQGDTIRVGCDIKINYNTYLLNGVQLDSLSSMYFTFGRPGQLVDGLNYAMTFLAEGERARIFMPSYLAFGEKGSSSGLVPRNTPVYFDVSVVEVITPEETIELPGM